MPRINLAKEVKSLYFKTYKGSSRHGSGAVKTKQNKKQQKKPYETAMKDSEDDINKWKDSMCL